MLLEPRGELEDVVDDEREMPGAEPVSLRSAGALGGRS